MKLSKACILGLIGCILLSLNIIINFISVSTSEYYTADAFLKGKRKTQYAAMSGKPHRHPSELLYSGKYTSADTFIKDLIDYIEYYNNERIKLRLNGMSPVQYRKMLTASMRV